MKNTWSYISDPQTQPPSEIKKEYKRFVDGMILSKKAITKESKFAYNVSRTAALRRGDNFLNYFSSMNNACTTLKSFLSGEVRSSDGYDEAIRAIGVFASTKAYHIFSNLKEDDTESNTEWFAKYILQILVDYTTHMPYEFDLSQLKKVAVDSLEEISSGRDFSKEVVQGLRDQWHLSI